jgi:hypothetical protein
MTGAIAHRNRIALATLATTGWSTTAPIANLTTEPLGVKARSTGIGTTGSPVTIAGTFTDRYAVDYIGLFATNLRQSVTYRARLWAETARTTLLFDTRDAAGQDRRVIPNLYDWRDLYWGAPNLFRGDLPPEDFALYPTNVHIDVPFCRAAAFQVDLVGDGYLPDGTDAGFLEVGLAWISERVDFEESYDYEHAAVYTPGDAVTRISGGGRFVEPGRGTRSHEIPLGSITDAEADRLFDLQKRCGFAEPVVWLPDLDDLARLFRYGFVGTFADATRRLSRNLDMNDTTIRIEELT